MKISLIVPIYNTKEEYLNECINSLLNQKYKNIEIIVINDGGKKDYDILKNKRIKVINTPHLGVSHARNVGIKQSSGDYVIFVDSDDVLLLNACSIFINTIKDKKVDVVFSRNYINDKNNVNYCELKRSKYIKNKRELFNAIFIKNSKFTSIDTPWAKIYRKAFLLNNNIYFNELLTNGEDGIFNYEVLLNTNNIYFLNKFTYKYRVNNESTCNLFSFDLDKKFINLIYEYEKLFKKYNIVDKNFNSFVLRILDRLLRKYYSRLDKANLSKKIYEHYDLFIKYNNGYYSDLTEKYFNKKIT